MYSDVEVNRYGQLRFIAGSNDEALMPYWGGFGSLISDTNSMRYKRDADLLVVAWNNRADENEFQAWIYADGRIRYLYEGILDDHDNRRIGLITDGDREYFDHTPAFGETLLLTPLPTPWVTYSPVSGSLDGKTEQPITYTANAADQTNGTVYVFTNTVIWGDGSTEDVVVTVQVGGSATAGMAVTPNPVSFVGPAGFISQTNMMLVNTGDVALAYTLTDTGARDAGYMWERTAFEWDSSDWDSHSGEFIPTDIDEGYSELFPIGFEFHYYGNVYTQFSIGVNGAVSLDEARLMTSVYIEDENSHATATDMVTKTNTLSTPTPIALVDRNQSIPSFVDIPDQLIAPCWLNFVYDDNSTIRYSGNENELVISWENIGHTLAGSDHTFQAILHKDGTIRFQYDSLSGSNFWPVAEIGLRDGGGARTTPADLIFPDMEGVAGTVTLITNSIFVVTNSTGDFDEGYYTNTVATNFHETVTDEAILFYPSNRVVITVDPTYGTLPVGGTNVIAIYGDARSLTPPGGEIVPVNTAFDIVHSFGTESVSVLFIATNSADSAYAPLDTDGDGRSDVEEIMFGSDGVVSAIQNTDGSRTISWPEPTTGALLDRNFIVWYTTDLMSGWIKLEELGNITTYTDYDHADEPVIYYRVTVE